MRIERKTSGSITILAFAGEMDTDDLPAARAATDEVIQDGGARMVFNVGQLEFLNSSAVAYFITVHKRLRSMGGELVFAEPSRFFESTVKHLGLDREFRIFPDDQAALEHLGEAGGA